MARTVAYWVSTGLVAALSLFAGFTYLSGSPPAVQGFAHVGYPQGAGPDFAATTMDGCPRLRGVRSLGIPAAESLGCWITSSNSSTGGSISDVHSSQPDLLR